ncbi:MAG: hypothetical protein WBM09_03950 [Gallionella sp.]
MDKSWLRHDGKQKIQASILALPDAGKDASWHFAATQKPAKFLIGDSKR